MAGVFLLLTMWNILGLCAALAVLVDQKLLLPADLRTGVLLLLLGFAGVGLRGQPFEMLAWPPVIISAWLTARFLHRCAGRSRTRRLLGRAVPHT